ncbi:MAG: hypothetical protein HFE90_12210 [Firmicutes bacterium]|nr:hypothetical protein [Bacillota bacterium]
MTFQQKACIINIEEIYRNSLINPDNSCEKHRNRHEAAREALPGAVGGLEAFFR